MLRYEELERSQKSVAIAAVWQYLLPRGVPRLSCEAFPHCEETLSEAPFALFSTTVVHSVGFPGRARKNPIPEKCKYICNKHKNVCGKHEIPFQNKLYKAPHISALGQIYPEKIQCVWTGITFQYKIMKENIYILKILFTYYLLKVTSSVVDAIATELRNVKFFTQTQILVQNFTPKMRNSQLICFCDKTRKSWSIQVVVGLVCYVRHPIGYLHRIWVKCLHVYKCALVKTTPLKYRI